ncbi:MAG: Nramp family divalent metal transporter [Planctomycetaceae bacterium]
MSSAAQYDPYAMPPNSIVEPPQSLWAALRKIGPGIILAGSIVGSGELLLTTSLGAEYGFAFLWLILFSCVVKVFVQIELGRHAISSAKPTLGALNDLPGPRWRVHWLVWWWFIMLLATVSQLGAMIGGVAQALNLAFPGATVSLAAAVGPMSSGWAEALRAHPEYPWAVLTALAAVGLLLIGGYKSIERITTVLVAAVTLITVLCVAGLPASGFPFRAEDFVTGFTLVNDTGEGWKFAIPAAGIAAAFGAFGITGVGASELYSYPYWCLEKGYARFVGQCSDDPEWVRRARGWLRVMHLDAWVSMVVFTTATVAFYILGATVLYRQGLHPAKSEMIATLSEMYVPTFGEWTKIAFLIGAWAVLFKTLYVASASNSRLAADFLGLARFVHFDSAEPRRICIRRLCVFFPMLGLVLYLLFRDPRAMVIFGGFFQAATLPIISAATVYMRYRCTDQRIAPSRLSDVCLWLAVISITIVAGYAIWDWGTHQLWPAVTGK